ncbi:RNA polymerase sigma factor [Paenibacillus fonticola]|uniref:RNA polymerase sigma factor n=1 Tax=Paenibacillus fonticola TaxID=379896 RepID=UPI000366CE0C|nr:RNA polymerase sigma factor [Paenibacillus fonticola]
MNDRELFKAYKEQVYRLCYYMLQNRGDAEDVCQEVFVKAILADRSQIRELRPWLLRIASNECNSLLKRRRNGWVKETLAYLLSRPEISNSVEENYDARETRAAFHGLLSSLPDKIRIVVILRYANELTIPEISKVIQIPEGTIKSRLNRGMELLRKKLGPIEKQKKKGEDLEWSNSVNMK